MTNSLVVLVVLEIVLHVPVALKFHGRNFRASDRDLSGCGCALLPDRTSILGGLRARDPADPAALRRRPVWRSLGLPGGRPTAELGRRTQTYSGCRHRNGRGGHGLGRMSPGARKSRGALLSPSSLLIAVNHSGRLIDVVYAKGMFRDPAWVEFARWNALSRVEVDRQGQGKAIVIDADASTYIMNADLAHWHGYGVGARSDVRAARAGQRSAPARRVRHHRPRRRRGRAARCGQRQPQRDWD